MKSQRDIAEFVQLEDLKVAKELDAAIGRNDEKPLIPRDQTRLDLGAT